MDKDPDQSARRQWLYTRRPYPAVEPSLRSSKAFLATRQGKPIAPPRRKLASALKDLEEHLQKSPCPKGLLLEDKTYLVPDQYSIEVVDIA